MTVSANREYSQETTCEYKGEQYSVRDNGAVLRHVREGKQRRKYDDIWTFGIQNLQNGYMYIGQARVHQIVATAFHGKPTDPNMVVDHKDTNRCNNRPENLRWVTRLENALNNPITRKKIIKICGRVESFLANPSQLNDHVNEDANFKWMRTVSKEEGQRTLKNMEHWAMQENMPTGKGRLGEWIFKNETDDYEIAETDIKPSLTINALQKKWQTETSFPCCPKASDSNLDDYKSNLHAGSVFSSNQYGDTIIVDFAQTGNSILVLSTSKENDAVKPWFLCSIYKDGHFIHENLGSFGEERGARKQFILKQGSEWIGGDGIDDYC